MSTTPSAEDVPDAAASAHSAVVERWVAADHPLLAPLIDDLGRDYDARYGMNDGVPSSFELERYPAEHFAPEHGGAFLGLVEGDVLVAGGALKRGGLGADGMPLGEIKRMWTHPQHRRRGLAGRVLVALERRAAELGYSGLELTTGARQPEAVQFYLGAGWTPDFPLDGDWEAIGYLRFTKPAPPAPKTP